MLKTEIEIDAISTSDELYLNSLLIIACSQHHITASLSFHFEYAIVCRKIAIYIIFQRLLSNS
jgi:hypothetical protein